MSARRKLPVPVEGGPAMPRRGPYIVNVEAGKQYLWCSCGLSKTQPWCDGSQPGGKFKPVAFEAPISGEFHMCGCKQSQNKPYCFGTCRGYTPEDSEKGLF